MKQNKLSLAVSNTFGAVALGIIVAGCGSNNSQTFDLPDTSQFNFGSISAKNIIVDRDANKSPIIKIQANQLPPDVQVLASQVTVETEGNTLSATDLQTAINTELAVDLTKNIIGVWEIKNYSVNKFFRGPVGRGKVEFKADGTFEVTEGGLAVAGIVAANDPVVNAHIFYSEVAILCNRARPIRKYEVIDGAIYFRYEEETDITQPLQKPVHLGTMGQSEWQPTIPMTLDGLATVSKNTEQQITMITGSLSCGSGGQAISKLTRVVTPATETKSLKNKPNIQSRPKV